MNGDCSFVFERFVTFSTLTRMIKPAITIPWAICLHFMLLNFELFLFHSVHLGHSKKKRDVQRGLRKKQQKWINKRFVCAAFLLETHSIIYQWR